MNAAVAVAVVFVVVDLSCDIDNFYSVVVVVVAVVVAAVVLPHHRQNHHHHLDSESDA